MENSFVLTTIQTNMAQPWQIVDGKPTAPVVLIKQGVWCGSEGCILHPAESLKNSVKEWEGKPVTLGHPQIGTNYVSVNASEEIFENYVIGKVRNPYFANKALRAYIHIEKNDTALWQLLQNTKEVSVGVITEDIPSCGSYNGKAYTKISQFYKPDHLAVLPYERGACSFDDGAGICVNTSKMEIYREAVKCFIRQRIPNFYSQELHREEVLLPIELQAIRPNRNSSDEVLLPAEFLRKEGGKE